MSVTIVDGVANLGAGFPAAPSFPFAITTSLIYSAQAYSAFPRALKLASNAGYLIALKGGTSHVGSSSGIILFSSDFVTWEVRSTIAPVSPTNTVQEFALSYHSDGRIQLITRHFTDGVHASRNRVQYSGDNGETWTSPAEITGASGFAYQSTRVGESIYFTCYDNAGAVSLYRFTADATVELVSTFGDATANSESGICVDADGTMIAHVRHEPNGPASSLYTAPAPYTSWTNRGTWFPWHGQIIRASPANELWGVGRWFHRPTAAAGSAITALVKYDGFTPKIIAYLPPLSSIWQDVGYGDLVWVGAETYPRIVFYAPGGTTTAIYTAKLEAS